MRSTGMPPGKTMKLRLLTVTAFAAGLVLTVRLGDIWQGLEIDVGGRSAAEAMSEDPAPAPKESQTEAAPESPRPEADRHAIPEEDMFTEAEIETLEDLAARREELDRRERELETRDALLQAAEKRIDEKVAELKALKAQIERLVAQYDEEEQAKLQSLVKIYESMKPKDAARIFGELEMDILLDVVERMREQKAAPILARMDPTKAKTVTAELAQRRRLSRNGGEGG
jgi:flagellar motility protein MotE (MotC chaperone)